MMRIVSVLFIFLIIRYCDPRYTFPTQAEAISHAIAELKKHMTYRPKTLVVCGTYCIGTFIFCIILFWILQRIDVTFKNPGRQGACFLCYCGRLRIKSVLWLWQETGDRSNWKSILPESVKLSRERVQSSCTVDAEFKCAGNAVGSVLLWLNLYRKWNLISLFCYSSWRSTWLSEESTRTYLLFDPPDGNFPKEARVRKLGPIWDRCAMTLWQY